ncbi:hypothetical protein EVAR_36745_1 [Eumeta japonica]|uniref:Uncharacterized protein n=1 Tax=Eumeta variegata TaxID=151549 RepID=A0A4C1WZZ5_EUMVA|nr:hypothetical protein EVAR_36745_1 [Eumeta japonica]
MKSSIPRPELRKEARSRAGPESEFAYIGALFEIKRGRDRDREYSTCSRARLRAKAVIDVLFGEGSDGAKVGRLSAYRRPTAPADPWNESVLHYCLILGVYIRDVVDADSQTCADEMRIRIFER